MSGFDFAMANVVRPAPGGSAVLLFAHGGALRLDVECLECELTDLGDDDLRTLVAAGEVLDELIRALQADGGHA